MAENEAREPELMMDRDAGEGLSGGAQLVSQGATLMRVEHETMVAVSVQRPRNARKVLSTVLDELSIVPAMAAECYYTIPYKQWNPRKQRKETVNVTGPSVHGMRMIARAWGNCSVKSAITGEDGRTVYLSGLFLDLENNFREERVFPCSKYLKRRGGEIERLDDSRLMQAILAAASKAERNAIYAGIPRWLTKSVDQRARELAANEVKQSESKTLEAFLRLGVTREMIEEHFGAKVKDLSPDQIADLRGFYTALRDEATTVEAIFGADKEDAAEARKPNTATVDDVLKAGVKEAEPASEPEKPAEAKAGQAPEKPFPCPECDATFATEKEASAHVDRDHLADEKPKEEPKGKGKAKGKGEESGSLPGVE